MSELSALEGAEDNAGGLFFPANAEEANGLVRDFLEPYSTQHTIEQILAGCTSRLESWRKQSGMPPPSRWGLVRNSFVVGATLAGLTPDEFADYIQHDVPVLYEAAEKNCIPGEIEVPFFTLLGLQYGVGHRATEGLNIALPRYIATVALKPGFLS